MVSFVHSTFSSNVSSHAAILIKFSFGIRVNNVSDFVVSVRVTRRSREVRRCSLGIASSGGIALAAL